MNIILINSGCGEDYLADLFTTAMLCKSGSKIISNYIPDYLCDTYANASRLYGRGYTAFCSVPSFLLTTGRVTTDTIDDIVNMISRDRQGKYHVVYTSIWRFSDEIHRFLGSELRDRCSVIALDGEDHTMIHPAQKLPITYFKRELDNGSSSIRPISFRLPVYGLPYLSQGETYIPEKLQITAPCDPRYRKSYVYTTQPMYYRQYSTSLFAVTTKKGGWDCLRHYEILANHCLPYFPGIEDKPPSTMADYPVDLQVESNKLYESLSLSPKVIDDEFCNCYRILLRDFLTHFYQNFTSIAYTNILK